MKPTHRMDATIVELNFINHIVNAAALGQNLLSLLRELVFLLWAMGHRLPLY